MIHISFSCLVHDSPFGFAFFFPLSSLPSHLFYSLSPRVLPGSKLQFSKLTAEVPVMFRVVELPQKHHICKVKSLNKGDANSEVTVYYQVYTHNVHARLQVIKSFLSLKVHFFTHTNSFPFSFCLRFIQSGPKALREHTLMELLVVSITICCFSVSTHSLFDAVIPPLLTELFWGGGVQMHMEEPCFDFLRTKETLG